MAELIADVESPETVMPPIPLEEWRPTKETLHRFVQIVGKVALAHGIRQNHWWHMTLRNTPRGWTTVELGPARTGPVFTCPSTSSTTCCGSGPTAATRRRCR